MKRIMKSILLLIVLAVTGNLLVTQVVPRAQVLKLAAVTVPEWVDVQLIPVDGDSRRGVSLEGMENIVIHYIGAPGTTAQQNRDYFANPTSEVSAHFVVGQEGEIIQCVPLNEKSSASNHRNRDTISIEVCHPDAAGKFGQETYDALVKLTAWLCDTCGLTAEDVIRHYDVTGKLCPLYYVENEAAWEQLKADIQANCKA